MTGSSPSAPTARDPRTRSPHNRVRRRQSGGPGAAHTQPSSMVITVGRSSATFQRPVTASIPPGSARRRLDGRPLASTAKRASTGARSPSTSIAQPSAWRRRSQCCGGRQQRCTELDCPVDEQGVEPVAVDEQGTRRHRAHAARCLPSDRHRLDRRKSGLSNQLVGPGHRQEIERRRGECLGSVRATARPRSITITR